MSFPAAPGYVWTGTVYARINAIPGDPENVLTPSQAAYAWGVTNPEQYLPPTTIPAPTQTPTYGMDEFGNIGPISDPQYMYSVNQADAGAAMLAAQLLASGANPNMPPPTVTDAGGDEYVYQGQTNTPAPVDNSGYLSQDAAAYFERYPELQNAYRANTYGLNPTMWAQSHYENTGRVEGRIWGIQSAPVVQTMTPPNTRPPVTGPTGTNTIPSDYLFPVGSTNNQSGGNTVAFTFSPSAFNDPAAYAYMLRYPDVLAAYKANSYGMTPDVFARTHYERFGVPERRVWGGSVSATQPPAGVGGGILPIAAAVAALFFLG